ncbi:MAG TPA: hypothetical protein VIY10_19735, partial [Solirubrobacteraceae bacterium]
VPDGVEEELRFFLESVVHEANATHVPSEDDAEDEADDGDEADEGDDADARMTARFQAFDET